MITGHIVVPEVVNPHYFAKGFTIVKCIVGIEDTCLNMPCYFKSLVLHQMPLHIPSLAAVH